MNKRKIVASLPGLLVFGVLLFAPTVQAGPLSLLAKAAKIAGKAGKGAKVAKGAATAGKLAAGGLAAERAVTVFRIIPDDVGRVSAFVSKDGDALSVMTRADDPFDALDASWVDAVSDLKARAPEGQPVDLYLDPTAAVQPPAAPIEGVTLHAVDVTGNPHPVAWDGDHWAVQLGEVSLDLAEFGADQIDLMVVTEGVEEDDEPEVYEVVLFGAGLCLLGYFGFREWMKPARRVSGDSAVERVED